MEKISTLYGSSGDLWAVFHDVNDERGVSWHLIYPEDGNMVVWKALRNVSNPNGYEVSQMVRVRDLT